MDQPAEKRRGLGAILIDRLYDPIQFRVLSCLAMLLTWYFLIYGPLSEGMVRRTDLLARERTRLALARELEQLKVKLQPLDARLPPKTDATEYLQYLLGGIRSLPLKLVKLDPTTPVEHGPFQVAVFRVEVEGRYADVHALVRWVEENPRLMRVDALRVEPPTRGRLAEPGIVVAQMTVLGILG
jgi:hypothetical protein